MASVEISLFRANELHRQGHMHQILDFQSRRKTTSSDDSDSDPDEIDMEKEPSAAENPRAYTRWQLLQAYETEFNKRPMGLGQNAAWLLDLEKNKEAGWYQGFFKWCKKQLRHGSKHDKPPSDSLSQLLHGASGIEDRIESTAKKLASNESTHFYLGFYRVHGLALITNGSALDPPTMPLESFTSLKLQHAHMNMFVGIRIQKPREDLCVLTLGNVWATTRPYENITPLSPPADLVTNLEWFDTKLVLAVDTKSSHRLRYYLIYKYEVYDVDYLEDGGQIRDEEPEDVKPPTFCGGPEAFTIGILRRPRNPVQYLRYNNVMDDQNEIVIQVLETKKPQLAMTGYQDESNPYVPVFPPRDKAEKI